MAVRSLYVVLGVPPSATPEMIRSAYRTRVKEFHPDRIGPRGASRLREVVEAYNVLSDPEQREAHNQELRPREAPKRVAPPHPVPAEPLVAEPIALRRGLHTRGGSVEDDYVDWTTRYFTDSHVPKSARQRHAEVDVLLSPQQAELGVVVPLHVPAFAVCPTCGGRGRDWYSVCLACNATGTVEMRRTALLRIPSLVRDGAVWDVAIPDGGVHLRVRVRIDPDAR